MRYILFTSSIVIVFSVGHIFVTVPLAGLMFVVALGLFDNILVLRNMLCGKFRMFNKILDLAHSVGMLGATCIFTVEIMSRLGYIFPI